jgi:hypothetical protein
MKNGWNPSGAVECHQPSEGSEKQNEVAALYIFAQPAH